MKVMRWYLEMSSPDELRPCAGAVPDRTEVRRAEIPLPELNRFLYAAVGDEWHWTDRLSWSFERWMEYLERPEIETWVLSVRGTPAGYFELERREMGTVEILFFGLLPAFIGRGLGGYLLTKAVERGWELGAARVTLNTCSLDHPSALAAYEARGFRIIREEAEDRDDTPAPGAWPGANRPLVRANA